MRKQRSKAAPQRGDARRYIVIFATCAIALGAVFRLVQLPTRVLYFDEAYTQMRVAGHTDSEMGQTLYSGRPRTALELRHDSIVTRTSSPGSLIASLIKEDAQHPPLFYLVELGIVKVLGNSLVVWRLLPALCGILAIAAVFTLALELFADKTVALQAAAIFAMSPIERIYSDQAREYSLFVLLVLIITQVVVRAIRANIVRDWALYTFLAAIGLYTSPLMMYVLAAHAVIVLGIEWPKRRRTILMYGVATLTAIIAYSPWLLILATHRADIEKTNDWTAERWPLVRLMAKWVFNAGSSFFDLEYVNFRWGILFVAVSIIACIAIARAFRASNREARWSLGAAIVVPAILLAAPDMIFGEHRSSVARYALPVFAMLPIVVARGVCGQPLMLIVILLAGLCSSGIGLLHASWWDNDRNADDARIAAIINDVPNAQVISDIPPASVITFARLLDDDVRISLSAGLTRAQFSRKDPVFVLRPASDDLLALQQRTGIAFIPVPFVPAPTAHNIGTHIGSGMTSNDLTVDLYRAAHDRSRTK